MTIRRLNDLGVDTASVINRLGGNEKVYLSICKKFLTDSNYQFFIKSFYEKDDKAAEFYIHTLKGVAANLGFGSIRLLCKDILEGLKNNDRILIEQQIVKLTAEYEKIIFVLSQI
jgi:HPt (histidine-containing phosphotransfer) domain-containing protein